VPGIKGSTASAISIIKSCVFQSLYVPRRDRERHPEEYSKTLSLSLRIVTKEQNVISSPEDPVSGQAQRVEGGARGLARHDVCTKKVQHYLLEMALANHARLFLRSERLFWRYPIASINSHTSKISTLHSEHSATCSG
jgi:hypothetical protein